jgi:ATP-dependent RNA helicase DeaD
MRSSGTMTNTEKINTEKTNTENQAGDQAILATFQKFNLHEQIGNNLISLGFKNPTPIQSSVFDVLLKKNSDLVALAQTGTGKTAAFGVPLIQKILENYTEDQGTVGLILCPTRELCLQVSTQVQKIAQNTKVSIATIIGGGSYESQLKQLKKNPSIVIATPGRLIDWIERKKVNLTTVKVVVLDEADEMLSMGFSEDLNTILSLSEKNDRNIWLFSATMSGAVKRLTKDYLKNETSIEAQAGRGQTAEKIELKYFTVKEEDKLEALIRLIKTQPSTIYGLIFCQTKVEVGNLTEKLNTSGIKAAAIHGDLKQSERESVIKKLRAKTISYVVATDVAARGIDIPHLTHVVNYHLPREMEVFVHRVGRTGRNGLSGTSWSLVAPYELQLLKRLSQFLKSPLIKANVPSQQQVSDLLLDKKLSDINTAPVDDFKNWEMSLAENIKSKLQETSKDVLLAYCLKSFLKNAMAQNRDLDFVGQGKAPRELQKREERGFRDRNFYGRDRRRSDSDRSEQRPEKRAGGFSRGKKTSNFRTEFKSKKDSSPRAY